MFQSVATDCHIDCTDTPTTFHSSSVWDALETFEADVKAVNQRGLQHASSPTPPPSIYDKKSLREESNDAMKYSKKLMLAETTRDLARRSNPFHETTSTVPGPNNVNMASEQRDSPCHAHAESRHAPIPVHQDATQAQDGTATLQAPPSAHQRITQLPQNYASIGQDFSHGQSFTAIPQAHVPVAQDPSSAHQRFTQTPPILGSTRHEQSYHQSITQLPQSHASVGQDLSYSESFTVVPQVHFPVAQVSSSAYQRITQTPPTLTSAGHDRSHHQSNIVAPQDPISVAQVSSSTRQDNIQTPHGGNSINQGHAHWQKRTLTPADRVLMEQDETSLYFIVQALKKREDANPNHIPRPLPTHPSLLHQEVERYLLSSYSTPRQSYSTPGNLTPAPEDFIGQVQHFAQSRSKMNRNANPQPEITQSYNPPTQHGSHILGSNLESDIYEQVINTRASKRALTAPPSLISESNSSICFNHVLIRLTCVGHDGEVSTTQIGDVTKPAFRFANVSLHLNADNDTFPSITFLGRIYDTGAMSTFMLDGNQEQDNYHEYSVRLEIPNYVLPEDLVVKSVVDASWLPLAVRAQILDPEHLDERLRYMSFSYDKCMKGGSGRVPSLQEYLQMSPDAQSFFALFNMLAGPSPVRVEVWFLVQSTEPTGRIFHTMEDVARLGRMRRVWDDTSCPGLLWKEKRMADGRSVWRL